MTTDIIIIGGGIVGLATALQLNKQKPNLHITLLEKEPELAAHQTGHNSGVIHSGLYYKPGSLKATNCLRGYRLLLDFCTTHNIPFERTGKIVIATEPRELPLLNNLRERGKQNGLENIRLLQPEEIKEIEPHAAGLAGLFVPQAGIVNYKKVAQQYGDLLAQAGVDIRLGHKVTNITRSDHQAVVIANEKEFTAKLLINCAGLYSDTIASFSNEKPPVKIIPFRGEYYQLKKNKEYLVNHLIYPVPDPAFPFLGVHFTRMMEGGIEAGPNAVLAFSREGYRKRDINFKELAESLLWPGFQRVARKYWRTGLSEMYRSFSKSAFTHALQKLVPEIQAEDLCKGGAGVRAQACDRTGGLVDDFMILESQHTIDVCNAPSPAATSSLAIGETIAQKALGRLS